MEEALFYALALGALIAGANVIFRRNPVVSTVNLVVVFFCLSGIYLVIGFPFLAAVQLLVYAGAILVLFLFVVLLLNLRKEEAAPPHSRYFFGWLCALGLAALGIVLGLAYGPERKIPGGIAESNDPKRLGQELFTTYLVPFEATGLLLLAAIVGVLLLSKRKEKEEA